MGLFDKAIKLPKLKGGKAQAESAATPTTAPSMPAVSPPVEEHPMEALDKKLKAGLQELGSLVQGMGPPHGQSPAANATQPILAAAPPVDVLPQASPPPEEAVDKDLLAVFTEEGSGNLEMHRLAGSLEDVDINELVRQANAVRKRLRKMTA